MSTTSITISYDLNPPESVDNELVESKSASFTVKKSPEDGQKAYYAALRSGSAIHLARNQLGDELTAWRDAVGKEELALEGKPAAVDDEEDDNEEDS